MKQIKPQYIVIAAVLVVFAVLMIPQLLTDQPGATTTQSGVVTRTIGTVEANAEAVFSVGLVEGSDPEHESEHMFEALAGLPGVGHASLDTQTLALSVTYNDGVISETAISERLMAAGYIAPSQADATPTELSADGSVQTISIGDDGTGFNPYLVTAQAGIPLDIDFAAGTECRVSVKFPELGVEQDISQGAVVSLPAMEPGEYDILCSGDGLEGRIYVQ